MKTYYDVQREALGEREFRRLYPYQIAQIPEIDKRGWHFIYQGDGPPEKDDWYWVWEDGHPWWKNWADRAWWETKSQRFLAVKSDVIAWKKVVYFKGENE